MPAPTTVLYRRDLLGRLVAAGTGADPKAHGAWTYRGDGALQKEVLKAGEGGSAVERSFGYDALGRPVSIDEPALRLDVSYRKDGDAAKPYADGGIAAETVTYKPAGFASGAAVPPSSTTLYADDGFGRLTAARSAQRPALNVDAAYDPNGNLRSLAQAGESRTYAYDGGTSRLDTVVLSGTEQDYAHDAAGAVTGAAGTSLVRDPASGRMRRAAKGGQSLSLLRDGRGRIALTAQGTAKRLTVRDGQGAVLWEKDGAAASAQVHGATGRIGLWTGTALHAVAKDLRGSTRILYGADAKAAAWLSFCAYGAADTRASSSNPLTSAIRNRYTGQDWLEPLALYDYGARLYDPALGRFLSPDPADETPSPYMYVGGDPVNAVDPEGYVSGGIDMVGYSNGFYFFFRRTGRVGIRRLVASISEYANISERLAKLNRAFKKRGAATLWYEKQKKRLGSAPTTLPFDVAHDVKLDDLLKEAKEDFIIPFDSTMAHHRRKVYWSKGPVQFQHEDPYLFKITNARKALEKAPPPKPRIQRRKSLTALGFRKLNLQSLPPPTYLPSELPEGRYLRTFRDWRNLNSQGSQTPPNPQGYVWKLAPETYDPDFQTRPDIIMEIYDEVQYAEWLLGEILSGGKPYERF